MTNDYDSSTIGLNDFSQVFKRYGRWMLLSMVLFGFAAFLLANFVMRSKWEAQFIIQIGQKPALVFGDRVALQLSPIEPTSTITTRMLQPSFQNEVLLSLPQQERARSKSLYASSLKIRQIHDADLIEVKLRGYSYEDAQQLADATLRRLQTDHTHLFQNNMQLVSKQLSELLLEAKNAEKSSSKVENYLSNSRNWTSFSAVVSATMLQSQMDELNKLKKSVASLNWTLQSQALYNTRLLSPISVTDEPVAPNKLLIILAATLFGLIASIIAAFIHFSAYRKNLE